jgi:hypothetical protein
MGWEFEVHSAHQVSRHHNSFLAVGRSLVGILGACAAPRRTAPGLLAVAGDEPGGHLAHVIKARAVEVAQGPRRSRPPTQAS